MEPLPEPYQIVRTFQRSSPTFATDVQTFEDEMNRWQRAAKIDRFLQRIEEKDGVVTITLMPVSLTPDRPMPPPPEAFQGFVQAGKRDGFADPQVQKVALNSEPVAGETPKTSESLQEELKAFRRGGPRGA